MAIAFDAAASGATTGTSISYSHTCSGSDRVLVAALVETTGTTKRSSAPTYNGVSMTQIGSDFQWGGVNRCISLWYILSPATGANTMAVSFGVSATAGLISSSYTGCDTTTQPNASNFAKDDSTATTYTSTITSTVDNCWHVAFFTGNSGTVSAGASTTERIDQTYGSRNIGAYDANAAKTPAGSNTLNFNISSSVARCSVGVMLSPLSVPASSNFLMLL